MALLEALTLGLGPSFAKAVVKLWLPDHPLVGSAGDGLIDMLKKRGESFTTANAADRLFRNLASDVAERLQGLVDIEFPRLPEPDREAAVRAVAATFERLELSRGMMQSNLNGLGLEEIAKPIAETQFVGLDPEARALAQLLLRESCGYAVTLAAKLPDFQVAATREILKRTSELSSELARVLDVVGAMREQASQNDRATGFETQYRRTLSQRLDRMQLFGVRLIGAGAREPEISVAYVTLTSTESKDAPPRIVDEALAGHTRIVIRGEAGSGKTTLLQWLAIRAASRDFPERFGVLEFAYADVCLPSRFCRRAVSVARTARR
jgi:hypothetical protein